MVFAIQYCSHFIASSQEHECEWKCMGFGVVQKSFSFGLLLFFSGKEEETNCHYVFRFHHTRPPTNIAHSAAYHFHFIFNAPITYTETFNRFTRTGPTNWQKTKTNLMVE